ncbi:hypothetical protein PoB_006812500 [Plakobranchus ocellatus]|uniref:Uncharacterized protein n=1 Tax=Plakobranchus ocellatus TaxID=259542 RepID=A0AAV4DC06_9GAST|nr:hypothetical protein PoB_006812500 [Plakobranchus ocellatus]
MYKEPGRPVNSWPFSSTAGDHECEVYGAGCEVAEGNKAWRSCEKNPGHERFIPASEFSIDDIPEEYRIQSLFDPVKSFLDVVVRLRVNYTSEKRPKGYPFHDSGGKYETHTGSGVLFHIDTFEGEWGSPSASAETDAPCQKWYVVSLATACHVVYNSEEAKETTMDFFYDDEDSRKDGRMKSLQVHEMSKKDIHGDLCILECVTRDDSLIEQLQLILDPKMQLNPFFKNREQLQLQDKSLCFVISHPHGRPKQITIGYTESYEFMKSSRILLKYKTDTCHGSSGGLVIMFYSNMPILNFNSAIHSSGHKDYNQSCGGLPEEVDTHRIRHNLEKVDNLIFKSHCVNPLFKHYGWFLLKKYAKY